MINSLYPFFRLDIFSGFVALAIVLFSVLTVIYSLRFGRGKAKTCQYYTYIILTALASIGVVLSNNLILLLALWGFLGLMLFLLINMGGDKASAVAKKTFIIVGGSDALMLLGIGIIYHLTGTFQMDMIKIPLAGLLVSRLASLAYLCLAIACFAKAGVMPFHSWIPDCAEHAPIAVVAYLPASLDKLLGIYLLARLCLDLFVMNQGMNIFLMLIGAFTIIAGVMMALIQHNMKRLLGYHAVSQVGYMVLGLGTGNPIGIAGGIFHMLNNSIYKQALFLVAGNVEQKAGTADLDKLGGLAKMMPLTYITAFIASLSISGVPPFNGFVSKWMIYQGLITNLRVTAYSLRLTTILCLVAAMFGSCLTLASFIKLLHATFLGQPANRPTGKPVSEVAWTMWLPCIILAALCIIFGVFVYQVPLKHFILPAIGEVSFMGTWYSGLSSLLVVVGLALGILLFRLRGLKPVFRQDSPFTGSETRDLPEEARVTGTEFYNTVKEFGLLPAIYERAEEGFFDIYEQAKNLVFGIGKVFQYLHNGVLPTYLAWCLLGMLGLFFIFFK